MIQKKYKRSKLQNRGIEPRPTVWKTTILHCWELPKKFYPINPPTGLLQVFKKLKQSFFKYEKTVIYVTKQMVQMFGDLKRVLLMGNNSSLQDLRMEEFFKRNKTQVVIFSKRKEKKRKERNKF
ncbi:hypothetical protein M0813_15401 [Anaeramoeba flamelloides]|uniref:Uncharacterized protein n=1 Tax=Anaeramoeba flamelloides TaxID=1746091 RepID=A0ABQ8Z124_9EUKA|nr:hypothetical protein M0813_15401 [Anaeramoeba flamelloides]